MRAAPETGHARARDLPRRGLEMPGLDALNRGHHDRAAALEVLVRQRPLAIFLQTRGPADAEDVLSHPSPHPVLRVPQGKEPGLEAEWLAFVVEAVPACQVVEGELDVVQLALYYLACRYGFDDEGKPLGFQPRFLSLWYPKDWVWGGMRQDIFSVGRPAGLKEYRERPLTQDDLERGRAVVMT